MTEPQLNVERDCRCGQRVVNRLDPLKGVICMNLDGTPHVTTHKEPVRLRIIEREITVKCPYGQGYGIEHLTSLKDCYLDSVTPGAACSAMSFGGRCDQVAKFREQYGWRSHKLVAQPVTDHTPEPVRLFYSPLNAAGTEWMAVNAATGERKHVDLAAAEQYTEARHGAYSAYLANRRLDRRAKDGAQLKGPYEGWCGGGEPFRRREWCSCGVCAALRPREEVKQDPAEVYRATLPADLRQHYDGFRLRTEAWRQEFKMSDDKKLGPVLIGGDLDFTNGFGQGFARNPRDVKSSQSVPNDRRMLPRIGMDFGIPHTVVVPKEPEPKMASDKDLVNGEFKRLRSKKGGA